MRQITLDTETTGLSAARGHRMIEIGCVELMDGTRSGKTYHTYLNPNRSVDEAAFEVHGLSDDFLKNQPSFSKKVDEFLAFVGDDELIIHNAPFDLGFLAAELARLKKPPLKNKITDTLLLAREKYPNQANSLDALCKRFSINLSAREKHGALLDASLLAEVFIALRAGSQTDFLADAAASDAAASGAAEPQAAPQVPPQVPPQVKPQAKPQPQVVPPPRAEKSPAEKSRAAARQAKSTPRLTPAEREAHAAMVGALKAPLWRKFQV